MIKNYFVNRIWNTPDILINSTGNLTKKWKPKKVKIKISIRYFLAFIIFLSIEIIIALFVNNHFIRYQMGDVLVVIVIYCFIKTFLRNEIKWLWLYIFIFALLVEIGQYFSIINWLRLEENRFARVVLGTTFDLCDIVCYFVGCMGIWIFEIGIRKKTNWPIQRSFCRIAASALEK